MSQHLRLFELAKNLASESQGFNERRGPGVGNLATNSFVKELGRRAERLFSEDFSEQKICGPNSLAVDFYFPDEGVIVEVALGLRNPNTEYEKDILKAIIAKTLGNRVDKLFFIAKPGGKKKCNQPGRVAIKDWLYESNGITIEVMDL